MIVNVAVYVSIDVPGSSPTPQFYASIRQHHYPGSSHLPSYSLGIAKATSRDTMFQVPCFGQLEERILLNSVKRYLNIVYGNP